jgi:hypothetical protein
MHAREKLRDFCGIEDRKQMRGLHLRNYWVITERLTGLLRYGACRLKAVAEFKTDLTAVVTKSRLA